MPFWSSNGPTISKASSAGHSLNAVLVYETRAIRSGEQPCRISWSTIWPAYRSASFGSEQLAVHPKLGGWSHHRCSPCVWQSVTRSLRPAQKPS
jgi:hypothetical protein